MDLEIKMKITFWCHKKHIVDNSFKIFLAYILTQCGTHYSNIFLPLFWEFCMNIYRKTCKYP